MEVVEDIVNQAAVHSQKTLAAFKEGMLEVLGGEEFQSLSEQFSNNVIRARLDEQVDPSALAEKNVDELWNSLWKVMKFTTVDPTPDQLFTSFCGEGSSRMSMEHFTRQERTLSQRRTSLKKEKKIVQVKEARTATANRDIAEREKALAKKEAEIASIDARFQERFSQMMSMGQERNALKEEVERLKAELEEMTAAAEEKVMCGICHQYQTETERLGSTFCGHRFHESCLKRWINMPSSSGECPKCKKEVNMDKFVPVVF